MIVFETQDDLFESPLQTLVCPVNVWGAMGKGLALDFRNRFDGLYSAYQKACQTNAFKRQGLFVFDVAKEKKVLCFPTKHHWRHNADWKLIDRGLEILAKRYSDFGITSVAMPAIGCGLGNLEWEEIYPLIRRYLEPIPLKVGIYLPY